MSDQSDLFPTAAAPIKVPRLTKAQTFLGGDRIYWQTDGTWYGAELKATTGFLVKRPSLLATLNTLKAQRERAK